MSRYFILPVYSVYLPKLSLLFLKNEKKNIQCVRKIIYGCNEIAYGMIC